MSDPLHIAYRPQDLDDVVGQEAICTNLARLFEADRVPHTFLFTGPSGCGKTTLARIIARRLECQSPEEIDAARYSGIEAMRGLLVNLQFNALGTSRIRVVIVDEAHALSKATWQTLLLSTEDPPSHLYWIFCTTEPDKIPATIKTRSHAYDLKPVKWDVIAAYLNAVAMDAKLKVVDEYIDIAARKASGSVRQALVFLSLLDGIIDKGEAMRLMDEPQPDGVDPVSLARMLVSGRGATWPNVRKLLEALSDVSPESVRIVVSNYAAGSLMKTESEKEAEKLLAILQAFAAPCPTQAALLLAVGSLLIGG